MEFSINIWRIKIVLFCKFFFSLVWYLGCLRVIMFNWWIGGYIFGMVVERVYLKLLLICWFFFQLCFVYFESNFKVGYESFYYRRIKNVKQYQLSSMNELYVFQGVFRNQDLVAISFWQVLFNFEFEVMFFEKDVKGSLLELLVKYGIICFSSQFFGGVLKFFREDELLKQNICLRRRYFGF